MPAQILTTDDLHEFKVELLSELKVIFSQRQEPSIKEKKYLKSAEVEELLGISPNTLYQMRVNRQLPFTKVNGTIFFDYADIITMMETNKKPIRLRK